MPIKLITALVGFATLAEKSNDEAHKKGLPDVFIHLHDWNKEYRVTPAPRISYKFPLKVKVTVYYLHVMGFLAAVLFPLSPHLLKS